MTHPAYDPTEARRMLEAMLPLPPGIAADPEIHYLLWEACIAVGDRTAGLAHLERAIALDPVRPSRAAPAAATPRRTVLALAAPGDFQANLPLCHLFDDATALHTLHLADAEAILADPAAAVPRLPRPDAVFIAIAEDRDHGVALRAADALAAAIGAPVINRGAAIASLSREDAARRLRPISGAVVPVQRTRSRAELLADAPRFPLIVRPLGSHAGRDLARIADGEEWRRYFRGIAADAFTVAPFVDSRWPDGLFRKIRVVFVDGRPHPLHLAVHDEWAVWYYNARMDRFPERRGEEDRFLADMETAVGPTAMHALHAIGREIGLDYVGLDAGLMPDGRLLVFEVETGMVVHDPGEGPDLGQRRAAFRRIRAAVERMIDGRAGGDARRPGPHAAPVRTM